MEWLGQRARKSFAHFVEKMKFGLAIGFVKTVIKKKDIFW
jgi:hypothetical protein